MSVKPPKKGKTLKPMTKEKDTERLQQLIFNAKTEQEKKMWQKVLDRVETK